MMLQIPMNTTLRPIIRRLYPPMLHRIIVNIIQRNIIMSLRPNSPIGKTIPHLTPRRIILKIPPAGRRPMNPTKNPPQRIEISHMHQEMIMIRQHNPGTYLHTTPNEPLKQRIQHLLTTGPRLHVAHMLIASSRKQIERLIAHRMRRRMWRITILQTLLDHLSTLFRRQLAILIHHLYPPRPTADKFAADRFVVSDSSPKTRPKAHPTNPSPFVVSDSSPQSTPYKHPPFVVSDSSPQARAKARTTNTSRS